MNKTELTPKFNRLEMPLLWQLYAFVLILLVTAMLFISDPITEYSLDIAFAVLNSIAVISGYFICKKAFFPWAFLIFAVVVINGSSVITSLIFFGIDINTQISLFFEVSGIILAAIFSLSLLYLIEKQYNLKGLSLDFTLIALSATCLIFLVSPNLLATVLYELDIYEKSIALSVFLGSIFLSLILLGAILSKNLKLGNSVLGIMVLCLSIHFYLDAFIIFKELGDSVIASRFSWFLYQFSGVLAILYIFTEDNGYNFKPNKAKKMGIKLLWSATILAPLIVPLGVFYRWALNHPNIEPFIIAAMTGVMSIIVIWRVFILIANYEKQRQKLKEIAFTDSLTGISNYLGIQSHISLLKNIFVLTINIEDFKSINDMYDRKFGDQVLTSLANRIKNTPGVLYAARTTGDNFLAIFQVKEKNIYETFTAFEKKLGLWDTVYNRRVAVPLTYGGSYSNTEESIDILVRHAEQALKNSRLHKTQFTLYKHEEEISTSTLKARLPRHELREILQNSIDKKELPIHFQPIYETQTGKLKALEMLIRVNSNRHGLLMPAQFLEQAKSYGQLTELTYVCINMIAKEYHRLPDVMININIPPYMLDDRPTLTNFINYFKSMGLVPNRFCIEVTEDGDIATERLIPAINLLKESGFAIAMDDFGTGYSSLGRLSSLPFDSVKIDRSLLIAADNGDKTILESAINLVKRLGVSVIVEGVETLEQLSLVRELGADSVQGFLFSKPVPMTRNNQFPLNATEIVTDF